MIEIGRLLELNTRHAHVNAFVHSLGDQYLYARNPLYRTIRDAALARGASYVKHESALWHDYMVCPLFCLDVMLEQKIIPLVDNESSLRRLAAKSGNSFAVTGKFLTRAMKRNYLLHESCHYIAHSVSQEAPYAVSQAISSESECRVLVAILGEAFATLVERIVWAVAQEPTHILFFNLNSYIDHAVNEHKLLTECIRDFGISQICEIGMLALFVNNLKKRPLNDEELNALFHLYFPQAESGPTSQTIASLIRSVFAITPAFLEETTPAYFRMIGLEKEFLAVSARDFSMEQLTALMGDEMKSRLLKIITSAIPDANAPAFSNQILRSYSHASVA
jgi:hypothetical protein